MKARPVFVALLSLLTPLIAQETAPKWNVEIPEPIADGTPSPPATKLEPINFEVLTSRTKRMAVTEAPEMPDLPPVTGTINVTVKMVKDPGLPDPPPPLPPLEPTDPAVIARLAEIRKSYRGTELVFLSASIYDGNRTLLRIFPNGNVDGEIVAWSNLNFNHFSGWSTYRVNDEVEGDFYDVGLLMGIGSMDTAKMRRFAAKAGRNYVEPEIPTIPDLAASGPAFLVIEGNKDSSAMDTLEQLHELYRKEGVKMAAASVAREKARAERKAFLLANPPKPEDVTIRFWKRGSNPQIPNLSK